MSYRKIVVDNTEYEYVVGKSHVKVKGFEAVPKEQVGEQIEYPIYCGCSAFCDWLQGYVTKLTVKPHHVAQWIKSQTA